MKSLLVFLAIVFCFAEAFTGINEENLLSSAQNGDITGVKSALLKGAGVNAKEEGVYSPGYTALMWASINGHIEIVKLLIGKGADIDLTNRQGETALILASENGRADVLKLLIAGGANVNVKINGGWTALMRACSAKMLSYKPENVELLISRGADVNARNFEDWTALMYASLRGNFEAVELLEKAGAKLALTEELLIAARNNAFGNIDSIISKGGNINAKNGIGYTALMYAAMKDHSDTVKYLLARGADINAQNSAGETALMVACASPYNDSLGVILPANDTERMIMEFGVTTTVKALIEKGAKINMRDNNGNTALMNASYNGYTDAVKLLIGSFFSKLSGKGADVNAKNNSGYTALKMASNKEIQKILKNNGAKE